METRKVPSHRDLVIIARRAAEAAAGFIRSQPHPSDPSLWDRKGIADFVTNVDREAERLIADHLGRDAPGMVIAGEELTPDTADRDASWVVDPLDGTTNYLHGYPVYAVSIAAVIAGKPRAAVIVDVPRGDTYHAAEGSGAWVNDRRLSVTSRTKPEDYLIGTGFPFKHPKHLPAYLRQFATILQSTSGVRRAGSAALDLAHVAAGLLDGFWELHLAPWDVAAGTLLVREAGGIVTDLDGSEDVVRHGALVAGGPAVHRWVLETLQRT